MATKINFENIFLCRGFTNSPINIHESSLELSHLFGTIRLNSYSTQNQNFYWKLKKMQTNQNMVAYYLRKWDFGSKDSKWIFKMDFYEEHLEKSILFYNEEINLKTTKHEKQTTKWNKRKKKSQNGIFLQPSKLKW